ncbi:hypothetical protein Elgi_14320 [Paenibacillus elgii]|nr:hypothetical protein Elgi_14320 [Paenibacillus elgii]
MSVSVFKIYVYPINNLISRLKLYRELSQLLCLMVFQKRLGSHYEIGTKYSEYGNGYNANHYRRKYPDTTLVHFFIPPILT